MGMALRRLAWAAVALAGAMGLSACHTAGPRYLGPAADAVAGASAAKGAFASLGPAVADAPVPGAWWRLYADPRLDALVAQAFAANTDLRIAQANLEKTDALAREARARRQPQVEVNLDPSFQQLSTQSYLQPGVVAPLGLIDAGVTATWEVDLFGRLHRAVQAADADREAAMAARDMVRVDVAAQTARAYAEACGAGEALVAARRAIALQEETERLTRRLIRAGRGAALDLTRVTGQVAQFQSDTPALLAAQRNALYRLAILSGRPPADYPRDLEACATAPRLGRTIPVGDGVALIRRRPDIREAERRLAAATDRIGVATADLYPRLTLGVGAGSTGAIQDVLTPETERYGIGPNLVWRLNQNAARARIAGAQADSRAALARFDEAVLRALGETETALNAYAHDLDRRASLIAVRDQAGRAVGEARTLYLAGRTSSLGLLDAQRVAAAADRAVAAADAQIAGDQISLFLALGGGWGTSP